MSLAAADRFVSAEKMREALEATLQPDRPLAGSSSGRHRIPVPEPIPDTVPQRARTPAEVVTGRSAGGAGGAGKGNGSLPKAPIPPRLAVRPLRLDAGYISAGSSVTVPLEIVNRGQGALAGRVETNIACLRVSPQKISGDTERLDIVINTVGLRVGPYVCHLAVRTNGGDQTVPIRFVVTEPESEMIIEQGGWHG